VQKEVYTYRDIYTSKVFSYESVFIIFLDDLKENFITSTKGVFTRISIKTRKQESQLTYAHFFLYNVTRNNI